MIGMTGLPIRKNQHAWAQLTNDTRDLDPVAKGVLDTPIRNIERSAPTDFEDTRCLVGLTRPVLNAAARAHLALREVEDGSAVSALRHLEQRAAASLLDVVAMCGDGHDVALWRVRHKGLKPHRHGDAVAQRNDRREPILRRVKQAVELHDTLGVFVRLLAVRQIRIASGVRYPAAPQSIVGNEEPALAHARRRHVEHAGIVMLIHVVEYDVEFLLAL